MVRGANWDSVAGLSYLWHVGPVANAQSTSSVDADSPRSGQHDEPREHAHRGTGLDRRGGVQAQTGSNGCVRRVAESSRILRWLVSLWMRRSGEGSGLVRLLVSPSVGFPVLWLVGAAMAQIHVFSLQSDWSLTTWAVVIVVPVAYVAGGSAARAAVSRWVAPRPVLHRHRVVSNRRLLLALLVVGYAELAHEFASVGAVPLLSTHIDATRVAIKSGALGLLVDALTVAAIIAIATPPRLLSRAALPELAIAFAALGGFALSGGRQAIVIAVAGAIARILYWGPPRLRVAAGWTAIGIALFSLVFYLRVGQELGETFPNQLYRHVLPGTPFWLVPLIPVHFALAMSTVVLSKVVSLVPHAIPFGHGIYDAYALHSILPAARSLSNVIQPYTAPWVDSTVAGPLWADWGMPAVVLGCLLLGAIITSPHALFTRTGRFSHAVLAGYFTAVGLYFVYDDLLTHNKDWVVVGIGLLLVGMRAETPEEAPEQSNPDELRRLSGRAVLGVSAAVVAVLIAVVAIADHGVARTRHLRSSLAASGVPGAVQKTGNVARRRVLTPADVGAVLTRGELAIDPGLGAKQVIWSISGGPHPVATPVTLLEAPRTVTATLGRPVALAPPPAGGRVIYDVGRWGVAGVPAAFELVSEPTAVIVRIVTLTPPSHVLLNARARVRRLPRGGVRTVSLLSSQGASTDLVVVDRSAPHLVARIYTAESRFSRPQAVLKTTIGGGFPSPGWQVLVGAVGSPGPDLVLVGGSRRAHIIVLPRAGAYHLLADQARLRQKSSRLGRFDILIGQVAPGQPADVHLLYLVNRRRGRIFELFYR